ncbi:alpha/beta hydrolase [Streptomyces mexicanus]|uniref:alpha/beta hydrolase n=1 Tax=Streptomyces mexicanus TaxID=178566 RepID=UPI0031E65C4F
MHWVYDGAPRLNNFLDGLRAVQGGPEAGHTTVSGPSYGSTAVGAASKAPGHRVWAEAAHDGPVPLGGKIARLGGYK